MNPHTTLVHITAYPDGLVEPSLLLWLTDHGFRNIGCVNVRGKVPAFNQMILAALASPFDNYIFAERDIRPNANGKDTEPFLEEVAGDIVGITYPVENPHAWDTQDAFHIGLWRTSRSALLRLAPPYFLTTFSPDGTRLSTCECAYFAAKCREAGLTIVRAGEADHTPRKGS